MLLYHGIAPVSGFANKDDAVYGLDPEDFAKQMVLLDTAGYETITLEEFRRFNRGEDVSLPPHPLLLTFDDARADSWTGGDGILEEVGFNAVMFVDVGRVEDIDPEYLTWEELDTVQRSGRWELQLHSGYGHQQIQFGPNPDDFGPFYAYEKEGETFGEWRERALGDITWGEETLSANIPSYRPLAFAPAVRRLRPGDGGYERPAHRRGTPTLAGGSLRDRVHPGPEHLHHSRPAAAPRPAAAHPRHERRRAPRVADGRKDSVASPRPR